MDPIISAFWRPLSQSPDWVDVTPASMAEGAEPVVSIQYESLAAEIFGYLYALMEQGESSTRALELSRKAVLCNYCGYSAWAFRWRVLKGLGEDLTDETFSRKMLESMPKNYQLWNHRRRSAEARGGEATDFELRFAARALEDDAKNYHAWAHRQAVVTRTDDFLASERNFVEEHLAKDIHNNSAWAHRSFVVGIELKLDPSRSGDILERELEYVLGKIKEAPHNASSWSYIGGLMTNPSLERFFWNRSGGVFDACFEVLKDMPSCAPALDFVGFMYLKMAWISKRNSQLAKAKKAVNNALKAWRGLTVVDPLRSPYWNYLIKKMEQELQNWGPS